MNFRIHCVGKAKDKEMQILIDEYRKRLRNQVEFKEVAVGLGADMNVIKKTEAEALLKGCKSGYKICLDEKGKHLNSVDFAKVINKAFEQSSDINFFIGGAYGHDKAMHENADIVISLSLLTFPHQMVRLILVEQIYRAVCIINNHPYHKI